MNRNIENIVGQHQLDRDFLNEKVLKNLINEDIRYISNQSKECIKTYINTTNGDIIIAKNLWINLLIDAICILKLNDSREKIYSDCKNTSLFSPENFKRVRKTSSYGINEIENYFNDFVEFERALYGSDEHYRDHVDHVIQVWALGISLINNHVFILNDGYLLKNEIQFHFEIDEFLKSPNGQYVLDENGNKKKDSKNEALKAKAITASEFWAMWTIASLCHDLGYPIEKTSKINKQAKKIISHFGNMNFSELNYSFDIFNTFLVDKFLNVVASKAVQDSDCNFTMIQTKYRDKFSKTLEDNKHGIFSSLLIYKSLTYFLETDYFVSRSKLSSEDIRQFYIRKEVLRTISSHTCPKVYHINLNTLSFLLILCDEIQEWNRPNFDEFRYKVAGKAPIVKLLEFDMIDKQKINIEFEYNFELSETDKEYIIKSKFKTIHCLLRSAKEDYNRKIDFEWVILFTNKRFKFHFNSKNNSFEQLSVVYSVRKDGLKKVKEIQYELY